jgi:hypothetical protein
MSSIAPIDLSRQIEAGLPLSTNAPVKEPVKSLATVQKTGGSRRYVLLAIIVAAIGVGTILGLSLGLRQGGSSSEPLPVESATATDTTTTTTTTDTTTATGADPATPNTDTPANTNTDTSMDSTVTTEPSSDTTPTDTVTDPATNTDTLIDTSTDSSFEPIIDDLPPLVVWEDMCYQAESALTDGTAVFGNAGQPLRNDLPICHEEHVLADGAWFTVIADESGEFEAEFSAFYKHSDIVDFVSIYEGDCDEALTCVEGFYAFDGTAGRYTWDAVEGVQYKVVVHSTGPFALTVYSPAAYGGCLNAQTVVVDGSTVLGQVFGEEGHPISDNVPACHQEHGQAGGNWYTVTADENGTLMGIFFAYYQHSGVDDFISVYEGECNGELTCVDGTYEFDDEYGYYTWDAVAGVEYKVIADAVGPFGLRIVTP